MASDLKNLLANSGQDEAVSVNQRALVEKILARYSGEFTVFRELLQNADDASAKSVEIHFRTSSTSSSLLHPSDALPNLKTYQIGTILAKNDGIVFREEDWNRLKKIAEGNPDEQKVGAFGVGFYSLFSLCDEPLVSSGPKAMGFYWKNGGDQLYVKTALDPTYSDSKDERPWTSFLMELREKAPMPEPNEFARFLTTCLGFTMNIREVAMHFDGHLLCRVTKTLAPSRPLSMRSNLSSQSPQKILRIESIEEIPLQLRAEVSGWLIQYLRKPKPKVMSVANVVGTASGASSFAGRMLAAFTSKASSSPSSSTPPPQITPSKKETTDPNSFTTTTLFLRTVSSNLKVTPTSHFSSEMIRATKKPLPSKTIYSLIWTGKDEFDAGKDGMEDARLVFEGLMSNLETNGRVFIGFPTFQTTGCAASVAARFISTVERESLDFQSRYVAEWNKELLWAGGVLARTVYEAEMEEIAKFYKLGGGKKIATEDQKRSEERALHLMQFFTFSNSTPSSIVGSETARIFFTSNRGSSITLISQLGPTLAQNVRLPNPSLSKFVKEIPTIPDLIAQGAPKLIALYREKDLVRDITLEDVLEDLANHSLTEEETVECFKWWISLAANRSYDSRLLSKLKNAAMIFVSDPNTSGESNIFPLGTFTTFLNPKTIQPDSPLPSHTLPFAISKSISAQDLVRVFGFEELTLGGWTKYLLSPTLVGSGAKAETNILVSPHFAEKVLNLIARSWTTLPPYQQTDLTSILSVQAFLPTSQGPKLPSECYFSNVNLFQDLPIVTLPSKAAIKGNLEKLLTALGVRRHVELQLVFTRLLGQGDWSHVELAKYLVSVRDTLSTTEIDRLRKTAWLPKEGDALVEGTKAADGTQPRPRLVRYPANQLFEPTDVFRSLGLPVLSWQTPPPNKWRSGSDEAKFLFELGLLQTPSVEQILKIAASVDQPERQEKALRYFLDNYSTPGFGSSYSPSRHALPFVPAVLDGKSIFAKPSEVFSNKDAALLGFPIISSRFDNDATRLQVSRDPAPAQLVSALVRSPPPDIGRARLVFAYLSGQVSYFPSDQISLLGKAKIIPVPKLDGKIHLEAPTGSFFATDGALPSGLKVLFTIIPDFGQASKPFLVSVGVKASPSTAEIAGMVVADPGRFFDLSGSSDMYLKVLYLIASSYHSLPSTLKSRMKLSAFFLGTKRVLQTSRSKSLLEDDDDDEEGATTLTYSLARAVDMVIIDDVQAYRVFRGDVLACPQEDSLEELAEALGAPRISRLVSERYRTSGEPDVHSKRALELYRTVSERTFLFLSEYRQIHGKSGLKHEIDWIQTHLNVFEVRSIELVRSLASTGAVKRHSAPASAYAQASTKGDVHLFVAEDIELDFYEVALVLCRFLLQKQNNNDALLFMTILNTPLRNLKRRGFNVDRILNARQAERNAAEQRLREERQKAADNAVNDETLRGYVKQLAELFPDADPAFLKNLLANQAPPQVQNAINYLLANPYPTTSRQSAPPPNKDPRPQNADPNAVSIASGRNQPLPSTPPLGDSGLFGNLKRKLRPESRPNLPLLPSPTTSLSQGSGGSSMMSKGKGSATAGSTPTSTDAIRSNVMNAVKASRPESASSLSNDVQTTEVRESQSSYCDSTAGADLRYMKDISRVRVYAAHEVPNPEDFIAQNADGLTRFIDLVVKPVGEVFILDPRSLHIFHDMTGPLIAFNRGGSLFLNFRYYKAWHDDQVKSGIMHDALISVYHTLAHEIAHNLVHNHDSQHEFYFSTLCETYFLRMAQLLARNQVAGSAL